MEEVRPRVVAMLPDLSEEVRRTLQPWVDSRGLGSGTVTRRVERRKLNEDTVRQIAASEDLDRLEAWCRGADSGVVSEAALRLIELGQDGTSRLAKVLHASPPVPCATIIAQSVSLWPEGSVPSAWGLSDRQSQSSRKDLSPGSPYCPPSILARLSTESRRWICAHPLAVDGLSLRFRKPWFEWVTALPSTDHGSCPRCQEGQSAMKLRSDEYYHAYCTAIP